MSKFKKKKKGLPAISTASLPDIVFMLLFFFMVSTTMRETDLLIKKPVLPVASEVKKLELKSLVSTIYIGKSKDTRIAGDKIQVNDKIVEVKDIPSFIFSERALRKEDEVKFMTTSIKADKEASVGTILDIKEQLRDINALKISFSTSRGNDLSSNYK
ncbi:MAG: ExbD/TolR family protein [Lutibacter sp.]|jgi:biopolymer transport protein ExbD|nr:MAG: biopolymer transporter ExbD [Lutibacter sp. BRH_c52]MDP2068650.1 biopolymer transporter ExbD [Lutibacter sp.]MDP3945619.1 biopolymer transporter ExbD [Lutibacter sp.]HCE55947.1 biopolymer transporter ExbD [Lutibacter sp.]